MNIEMPLTENPELNELETPELNESETPKISYQDQIETVIASLEDDNTAMVSQNENGFLWKFQYGSVEVFVQLTGESNEDLLTVWSVIMELPSKNDTELMKKLLEMNWLVTFETYFALIDNQVVISTQRTVEDLSPTEISRAITLVANIADENDEQLQKEFGITN
jgi:hypothetical protein